MTSNSLVWMFYKYSLTYYKHDYIDFAENVEQISYFFLPSIPKWKRQKWAIFLSIQQCATTSSLFAQVYQCDNITNSTGITNHSHRYFDKRHLVLEVINWYQTPLLCSQRLRDVFQVFVAEYLFNTENVKGLGGKVWNRNNVSNLWKNTCCIILIVNFSISKVLYYDD